VQYDLKTINAVLRWGMTVNDRRGRPLVDRHPFAGLAIPSKESPPCPRLSHTDYGKMLAVADQVHPQCKLALVLAHETGHRLGAIRMLSWFDIDLKAKTVRWRAENDKIGFEHTTALTASAVAVLEAARGDLTEAAWVFPAPEEASQPTSRYTFRHFWDRAEKLAKLEPVERRGWHSLRRAFATEMKHAPLRDLAYLGGWKSVSTVVEVYQQPDDATMRAALEARRPIEARAQQHG
jgi:integrase